MTNASQTVHRRDSECPPAGARAIINARVFDGERLCDNSAVVLQGGYIRERLAMAQLATDTEIEMDLEGGLLLPGFIDLQVNGGGGLLFNDEPTVETLRGIGAAHRRFGTTGFLPTVITDSREVMVAALTAVEQALTEGVPGVLGIHLEGPFINPARCGIHDAGKCRVFEPADHALLTSLSRGRTLVTLAPECVPAEAIRALTQAGVVVSAGHSGAGYEEAMATMAAGLTGVTHLYNAMEPLRGRQPGLVGFALSEPGVWFSVIADGIHVHPASLRLALAARPGGAVLVTDAMPCVGADSKRFLLNGVPIVVENGRCTDPHGTLAGSDLDMLTAINTIARETSVDWFEAVRMASLYPARALGLHREYGRIAPGYRADLVSLDRDGGVRATWVAGQALA